MHRILKYKFQCWLTLFIAVFIVNTNSLRAQNTYYIDSQYGNDNYSGLSQDSAWQSHTKVESTILQPGDTVYFARGAAWIGGIQIDASGSDGSPIVFTNYGSGDLPKFSNPNWSDNTGNAIRFAGDYLIADGLYFHNVPPPPSGDFITVWSAGALRLLLGADHCIIRNCYFNQVPKAIQSHGEYTLITHNTMVGEQVLLGSQYWGPIGIQIGIGNQEICYNTIREFWVTEGHAWGQDGGAMEMDDGRNHKDNVYIHHNRTINNCGFLEISWDYDIQHREVWNLRVAFNVSSDFQSIGFLEAPLHDSYIDNNTFDRTRQLPYNSTLEVQLGTPIVRNNLFIFTQTDPYRADDGQLHVTPQNNWYYKVDNPDQIYYPESAAGNGNPKLIDFVSGKDSDYHLTGDSPLRGAAQNLSEFYSTDFEGNSLPDSGAWDVGAFQYQGSVMISAPEAGEIFYVPVSITIEAQTVEITNNITKMEFYNSSNKLGEDHSSPYSYSWNVDQMGTYQLTVSAILEGGSVLNSSPVWIFVTDSSREGEHIWHSYDVVTNTGFQPATVLDQTGTVPAIIELYMSSNAGGVEKEKLFSTFLDQHIDFFNHVEDIWANATGRDAYPYAGKSAVDRGSDTGESNTPPPSGVRDLQLHPPDSDSLAVAAFMIPINGTYSISDLAVRRVHNQGGIVAYKVFDNSKMQIASLTAANDRTWVTDAKIYELGFLSAGVQIYFAIDKGENDNYYWDATEIVWTVTLNRNTTGLEKADDPWNGFHIEQNYPNPFNSDTMISFNIPKTQNVTLNLYDIMGQKVATLLKDNMKAGKHFVHWNGRNNKGDLLPSGVYFYSIKAGSYHDVKNLLLVK
jgi:hypothetical protein